MNAKIKFSSLQSADPPSATPVSLPFNAANHTAAARHIRVQAAKNLKFKPTLKNFQVGAELRQQRSYSDNIEIQHQLIFQRVATRLAVNEVHSDMKEKINDDEKQQFD